MTILTAEEFKDRLKTQHVVTNVVVKEPVTIDFRDGGSFSGDLVIRNCDLKSFRISELPAHIANHSKRIYKGIDLSDQRTDAKGCLLPSAPYRH